jgi:multidrug efflux system membrane fusion protein
VDADQAQIDLAQVQLSYCSIRSPIDGRVGTRLVDAGNIVHAADTTGTVTINQIRPIWVSFALPAASLADVRARLKRGEVEVVAEGADSRELATGKLAVIDNQINATTATIAYKASFENADEALWPGQFVNIRLLLQVRRHALTVPLTAVVRGPDGTYVFLVGADRVVQKRPIKLGFANKTTAIVESGLAAGDRIVTDGQYRIESGSRVEILPPAVSVASPAGAAAPEATP